jgi:predicted acetyltransferase
MALEVRAIGEDELAELYHGLQQGFGFDAQPGDMENFAVTACWERTRCAFEDGQMVGTLGAYPLDMTVPGAVVPLSGTTWVTVLPTHRRRGVLKAMMRAHLDDTRERGETLAALWASEASIYGRFGYGMATLTGQDKIEKAHAQFARPLEGSGRVRLVSGKQAREIFPEVFDTVRPERPGFYARTADWWESRYFHDPPEQRRGWTSPRYVVYEAGGRATGYASYATRGGVQRLPSGSVHVRDVVAIDDEAEIALWRYLLDIDLMTVLEIGESPPDLLLQHLLADPRRLERSPRDGLWLRPVDATAALCARRYASDGQLVFELEDAWCPWNPGVYALDVDQGHGECKRSQARPDVWLDAETLGAIFLGGMSLRTLARAGRARGTPEALARADALFAWHPLPFCPETF